MYIWQKTPLAVYAPKYLLNGFPKSGLHLVEQMVSPITVPMRSATLSPMPWVGTFKYHSFSDQWIDDFAQFYWKLARIRQGEYLKGHVGYRDDIADHCWKCGLTVVFIYRDPRDVAVSQAYHVLSVDDDRFRHADKNFYRKMAGGFDDVLAAVIEGIGPYPGVMHRWELYAGWLDVDWVLKLRYEDLRADPKHGAGQLLQVGLERVTNIFGAQVSLTEEIDETLGQMVEAQEKRVHSATFRKGNVGDWREEFTDRHKKLFKASDVNNWLVRLGYERKRNW